MTIDQLEAEALKLPQEQRTRLAQRLLASLDEDAALVGAWYDEAERRLQGLESGDDKEVPLDDVFASHGLDPDSRG